MAGADGSTPDDLTPAAPALLGRGGAPVGDSRPAGEHLRVLDAAREDAHRWEVLALLRRAEAHAPTLPRIGRSRLPGQNIVDLAHTPSLAFPAPNVESIEPAAKGARRRVRSLFLGLTGPMGALPIHLTEYAFYERRMSEKRPFGRWLDVLTDRMLQFFYRAWADTQPAAQADRPGDDRFGAYVAALSGATAGARSQPGGFPADRRLHYAGAFVSRRSAAVLRDGLSHILKRPVRLKEFVARWRDIDPADRTRIGSPDRLGRYNRLGRDMVLGARVRQAEDTFRVMVRAVSTDDYRRLLPGQAAHQAAREALQALAPSELSWELELEIAEPQAPGATLDGQAPLGLMSWVSPQGRHGVVRADARIRN